MTIRPRLLIAALAALCLTAPSAAVASTAPVVGSSVTAAADEPELAEDMKDQLDARLRGPKVYGYRHLSNQDGWYWAEVWSTVGPTADQYPLYDVTLCRTDVVTKESVCQTKTLNANAESMRGFAFQMGEPDHDTRVTVSHAGSGVRKPFRKSWLVRLATLVEMEAATQNRDGNTRVTGLVLEAQWRPQRVLLQRKLAAGWRTIRSQRFCGQTLPKSSPYGASGCYRPFGWVKPGRYRMVIPAAPGLRGCVSQPLRLVKGKGVWEVNTYKSGCSKILPALQP